MFRAFATFACLALCNSAAAQSAADVSASERARFGHGELRSGADGNNPDAVNYANFEEEQVGDLTPPPIFRGDRDATPAGWRERRAEIAALVESEFVGSIPDAASHLDLLWSRYSAPAPAGAQAEHFVGQITGGGMGPVIDAVVTLPEGARNVPVVIEYTYILPPGFRLPGPPWPPMRDAALARGWGHVAYRPTLLQADDLARLADGVIAGARFPREESDWGALRAWGWGASRLREHLASDPRIDAGAISLAGHSRFGKAVLVAAAFDHAFADALVSSSGAGGAKLMRRDFGERLENMADPYASIWYAPRIRHYAGNATVADWPVDAHMLIALRAPRPLLIATGTAAEGDGWTDPRGQWIATDLARPAWALHGLPVADGEMPQAGSSAQADFPLGWFQHEAGHVMYPAYDAFFDHAERFAASYSD